MNDQPRVSVVMGVYNGQANLRTTIDSILSQSFEDLEFIVVDDGSNDGTDSILEEYTCRDSRLIVIRQENAGLTRSLIAGCDRASGELIVRQDVGDRSAPSRIQKQVRYFEANPDVVAIDTGVRRYAPRGEFLGESVRKCSPDEMTRSLLSSGEGLCHPASAFRADAYLRAGGYRPQFRFAQDTDLWYRMTRIGKLAQVNEPLLDRGIDTDGISSTRSEQQIALAGIARRSFEAVNAGNDDADLLRSAHQISWESETEHPPHSQRATLAKAEYFIGSQLYALGDDRCRHYLLNSIASRPFWFRPWTKWILSFLKTSTPTS